MSSSAILDTGLDAGLKKVLASLSETEKKAVVQNLEQKTAQTVAQQFVTPIKASKIPRRFKEKAEGWLKFVNSQPWLTAASLADLDRYGQPFTFKVRAGYTSDQYFHLMLNELGEPTRPGQFQNDEPTKNQLVFCPLVFTKMKTIEEMDAYGRKINRTCGLPSHHNTSFGSKSVLDAILLTHYRLRGNMLPRDHFYATTDTFYSKQGPMEGARVVVGGWETDERRNVLRHGYFHPFANSNVGFFPIGFEDLEESEMADL